MKILIANKFFFDKGGSETVLFQERKCLMDRGVEVVDFSMADERNIPSAYAGHFISNRDYHAPAGPLRKLALAAEFVHNREAVRKISRLVRDERPDLAHLHNIYHQLTPSIMAPLKRAGTRVVMTLHDLKLSCPAYLMVDSHGEVCEACSGRRYYRPVTTHCQNSRLRELLLAAEAYYHLFKRSYNGVDRFIVPSRFYRDMLCTDRLPEHKVRVIPNGIDLRRFPESCTDSGYALYVGRLSREKGIPTLLEAHHRLKASIPLKIVGTGPLEQELRTRYPLAEYLGHLPHEKVLPLVNCASYVVIPSQWHENCPMAALEAMALGKPIIASRVGGIPELVEDERTGLLFRPADVADLCGKLELLWTDGSMRREMGRAARERVRAEFTLELHIERLLALYEELAT